MVENQQQTESTPSPDQVPEDMLHIIIGGKNLLLQSSHIKEVVRPAALTQVPVGPKHIIGLANIHGQIVCIIDVGGITSLAHASRKRSAKTRFLILRHPVMHVGIWADEVCRIQQVDRVSLAMIDDCEDSVAEIEIDGKVWNFLDCSRLFR